jgi:transcriptional regulator with XRE-family HTH domain
LRALRDYCGRTQLEVELDANLGIGYLQRVESGKVRYPERDTLERILKALSAPYTERRDILELFGYVVDTPLPDAQEIDQAVRACRQELDDAVFPAYLLDCAHRLLGWNAFFARVFGNRYFAEPVSMLRLLFNPAFGVTPLIANPDEFFPAQIRALRYQMRLFRGEAWYNALIADLLAESPLFKRHWEAFATALPRDQQREQIAARALVPLRLDLPATGLLSFRLTAEPFAHDRRFRVLYYLPADAATIQQCVAWLDS